MPQKLTKSRLNTLTYLVMASLLGPIPAVVMAQDGTENRELEEIVVTGSRIGRSGADMPVPITIIDAAYIEIQGTTQIADILRALPQLGNGTSDQNAGGGNVGLNLLNLRRMGIDRTLVLVNGRRHVGSQAGNTAVDVSTIPSALVERVEVITGGASAIYGADAVTGVVNFILRDDFEGIKASTRMGLAEEGDGFEQTYEITAGTNLFDDRGNLTISLSYSDREIVEANDRNFSDSSIAAVSGDLLLDRTFLFPSLTGLIGVPLAAGSTPVCNNTQNAGPFGSRPRDFYTIDAVTGELRCFDLGVPGSAVVREGGDGLDTTDFTRLRQPTERFTLHSTFNYDLGNDVSFFATGKYALTTGISGGQPVFDVPNPQLSDPIQIRIDNAFLPDALRDAMVTNNLTSINMTKGGFDLGERANDNERDLFQIAFGFDGSLTDNIDWSFYLSHGESTTKRKLTDRLEAREKFAQDSIMDASGNPICRISITDPADPNFIAGVDDTERAACAPRNPFVFRVEDQNPAALEYLLSQFVTDTDLQQDVLSGGIQGSLAELPAGSLGFALGLEYRREESDSVPEIRLQNAEGFGNNPVFPVHGDYDVYEVFGEVLVPLLKDQPFADYLGVEAAYRFSDYNTVGQTDTYKFGLDWSLSEDIRIRSVFARAVRAPNVGELFTPESAGNSRPTDPCDPSVINNAPPEFQQNRINNCATLVPVGYQSFTLLTSTTVFTAGNPDLLSEESDTFTAGIVLTPRFLPGFSLTVDYWDIDISDAISTFAVQDTLENCVDASTLDNPFCSLVFRFPSNDPDPNAAGQIDFVRSQQINVAKLVSKGVDFEARYIHELGSGNLEFRALAGYVDKHDFFANPARPEDVDNRVGLGGNPEWEGQLQLAYRGERFTGSLSSYYQGSITFESTNLPEDLKISDHWTHNVQARFRISDIFDVYGGVNNLFDKDPPAFPGIFTGAGDAGAAYANLGRYFYIGGNFRLGTN